MATPAPNANPRSPYVFTEARRRAALQNLEKARAARACQLAERSGSAARRGSPEGAERARARAERRFQKRQQHRREHGFFFFRRWGLYVVSFARSMKRLGESALDFDRLGQWCERLLGIEARASDEKETRDGRQETSQAGGSSLVFRLSSLGPHFLRSVARSLAQVIWLGRRVRRCLDEETAVRLEARLLTMAELQAILRGDHGAEARARLREHLGRVMGPELDEYKNLKMFGADPELVWPRRLSRRLMEMILEVVDDRPDRHAELAQLRRRMKRLLREASGGGGQGKEVSLNQGTSADEKNEARTIPIEDHGANPTSLPALENLPSSTPDPRPLIPADPSPAPDDPNTENTSAALSAGRIPNPEEKTSPQTPNSELRNSELTSPEEKYWARYDRLSPAAHHRRLAREHREADQHGLTIEELRDHRWLKPAEALSRFFWRAGQGWFGESRHQKRGAQRYPVRESYAAGPEPWWPEAREIEIRAEVEWRRHSCLRDSGSTARSGCATAHTRLAYSELKDLVAAAFGLPGRGERQESRDARQETRDELAVSRPAVIGGPLPDGRDEKRETSTPDRRGETRSSVRGFPSPQSRAPSPDDLLVSRLSPLVSGNPSVVSRLSPLVSGDPSLVSRPLESVARLLWLIIHTGEWDARCEERRLENWRLSIDDLRLASSESFSPEFGVGGPSPEPGAPSGEHRTPKPESRVPSPQTPNSELRNSEPRDSELSNSELSVTRHLLNALRTHDAEAEFRRAERQARLSEALRRLGQALYPEPIQARTELGYLYRLKDEFDRLRLDPLWSDAGRKAVLRQDLGLDPLPEGFETPELPEELLDPRSAGRRGMLRALLRSTERASWRERRETEWEEERIGTLFAPEDAREIEAGRWSMDDWRRYYFDAADGAVEERT